MNSDRLGCLVTDDTDGERIRLRIGVMDGDKMPVDDALVELWQAERRPVPLRPPPRNAPASGGSATGEDGWCAFETIQPGAVPPARTV